MKIRDLKGLLFLFVLSVMTGCQTDKASKESPVIDKEQIKKEIQAKENEFASIFIRRNKRNRLLCRRCSFICSKQTGTGWQGSNSRILSGQMDSISKNNTITFTTNEVFVPTDGSLVVEIGYYKVVDPAGNLVNSGNYMSLFEKRDGKYVSIRDMSTSDLPLE